MSAKLAERVDNLERELAEIKSRLAGTARTRDWRNWIGASRDDPGLEEMIRLGREYRESQRPPADDAGDDAGS